MSTGSRLLVASAAGFFVIVALLAALVVVAGMAGAQEDDGIAVREVTVVHRDDDEITHRPVIDALEPETLLAIRASGFPGETSGFVSQCTTDTIRRCTNRLPVRFDDDGGAVFQFLVNDTIDADGGCRLRSATRCTLEIEAGSAHTVIDTVFVDAAPPPGRLEVSGGDIGAGDSVAVTATGFPPEVTLTLRVCATPSTRGDRCGPPGPEIELVTDLDGEAETELAFATTEVGADRVACGRRTTCHLVLDSDAVGVRATPVRLAFATTSGADYDGRRLALGIGVAAFLVALAVGLVRSGDWQPPAEADASEIDDAEFADLDAEAESFEEAVP